MTDRGDGRDKQGFLAFLWDTVTGARKGPVEVQEDSGPSPENIRKAAEEGGYELWGVNEIVAYNLRRARQAMRWSQEQLAEELSRHTGRSWSNATVSAAERSRESGRTRRFDAADLVSFALVFGVPVNFFLIPPDDVEKVNFSYLTLEELSEYIQGVLDRGQRDAPRVVRRSVDLLMAIDPFVPKMNYVARLRAAFSKYAGRDWNPVKSGLVVRGTRVEPEQLVALLRETADAIDGSVMTEVEREGS